MHHLDKLRELLPNTRVTQHEDMLVYSASTTYMADHIENLALNMIILHQLPLVVEKSIWGIGGKARSGTVVVTMAPEAVEFRHQMG